MIVFFIIYLLYAVIIKQLPAIASNIRKLQKYTYFVHAQKYNKLF